MSRSPILTRFMKSFGAYGFGQLINVGSQFALVPLFIHQWGADRYGEWLVLSALPAVVALSDVGFCSTGANSMALHAARGNIRALRTTLHTLNLFLLASSAVVVSISAIGLYALPINEALGIKLNAQADSRLALLLLAGHALVSIFSGLIAAIYRAGGRNARGVMAQNLIRLSTLALTVIVVSCTSSVAILAAGMLLIQLAGTLAMIVDSRNDLPNVSLGVSGFDWAELKSGLRPALAFTAMPLGNAIYFQGLTLLANHLLGAAGVVTFNTLRTFSRVIVQAAQLLKHASWPEFSLLLADEDKTSARWFHRLCFEANLAMSLAATLFSWSVAGWLIPAWTHGSVAPTPALAGLFLLSALLACTGMISLGVLQSSNAHEKVSWQYLGCYVAGWLVALAAGATAGQFGLAWGMVAAEALILVFSVTGALTHLNEKWGHFTQSVALLSDVRLLISRRMAG